MVSVADNCSCRGSKHGNLCVMGQSWPFACCGPRKERMTKKFGKTNVYKKACSKELNSTNKPGNINIHRYEVNLTRFL